MDIRSRTITFSVNRKTAGTVDGILNIPPKMIPDAMKSNDGWWSFTPLRGPAKLKFYENRQLGILDYQFIDNEAKWNVPMRVISNGNDSAVITTIIKPDGISDQSFDERMIEIEKIMESTIQLL